MQIRRREFVIATLSVVPAVALGSAALAARPEASLPARDNVPSTDSRFAISGWHMAADGAGDRVLIPLSSCWRAAWH